MIRIVNMTIDNNDDNSDIILIKIVAMMIAITMIKIIVTKVIMKIRMATFFH